MEISSNSAIIDLQNPHEEYITDEASGLPVANQRYTDWQSGYCAGVLRLAQKITNRTPVQKVAVHLLRPGRPQTKRRITNE